DHAGILTADAVQLGDDVEFHAQVFKLRRHRALVEESQGELLTVHGRGQVDAEIDAAGGEFGGGGGFLSRGALGHGRLAEELDIVEDRNAHLGGYLTDGVQQTVNTEAN